MWVPPKVSRELQQEREQFNAAVDARVAANALLKVKGVLDEFNYELQQIDRNLQLMRLDAAADTSGTPFKAGYYHVVRMNDGAPVSVMVVEDEHGRFMEPSSRLFEQLRKADLWDSRNMRALEKRDRLADEAAEKRKVQERKERQQEMVERWAAASRTQVSMNTDVPWTQNASKTSQRDRDTRKKKVA